VSEGERPNDNRAETVRPLSEEEIARELRLRPDRPRVVRLSRRMLAIAAAIALGLISGAVLWALQSNRMGSKATDELLSTDHRTLAEGLSELPRDYTAIPRDVPRLGPPLPGDIGRPIVAAQNQTGPIAVDAE